MNIKCVSVTREDALLILSGDQKSIFSMWKTKWIGNVFIVAVKNIKTPGSGEVVCQARITGSRKSNSEEKLKREIRCGQSWDIVDIKPVKKFYIYSEGKHGVYTSDVCGVEFLKTNKEE